MTRSRRRGEGYVEYIVIIALITVCSVVGLLRAGSEAIDNVATSKALCTSCPEAKLRGDDLDRYHKLRASRSAAGTLSATDEDAYLSLASKRRDDLEDKRAVTGLTDGETEELDDLNSLLPERADTVDEVEDGRPRERPGLLGAFDRIFGVGWEDTWIASLMGIFGWFGFFTA